MTTDPAGTWPARRFAVAAAVAAAVLVGGLGGWAAFADLAGAVIAPGKVRGASNRQVVQHRFGGTVAAIEVRDGERVRAGDILLRLNDTKLRADRAILQRRLDEGRVRRARLVAERDDTGTIVFAGDLVARAAGDRDLADIMAGQERLWAARTATHNEARAQLVSRRSQIRDEIAGFEAQVAAAHRQKDILLPERDIQRNLYAGNLIPRTTVVEFELRVAGIDRDLALFVSEIAAARSRIGETEITLSRLEAERLEAVIAELRELDIQILDLEDELRTVEDQLSGTDITAPVAGIVHASTIHTLGAVIRPADPILSVVPLGETLIVELRVEPQSIDQLHHGQTATVRFPAFNARLTPELAGTVERVSADRVIDGDTGRPYYVAEVVLPAPELERLEGQQLIPGMPVEAFLRTTERTPLSYLLKPLTDHLNRVFREE